MKSITFLAEEASGALEENDLIRVEIEEVLIDRVAEGACPSTNCLSWCGAVLGRGLLWDLGHWDVRENRRGGDPAGRDAFMP